MFQRWHTQLARVSDKQADKEFRRIRALFLEGRISSFTRRCMERTAKERLAFQMGVFVGGDNV